MAHRLWVLVEWMHEQNVFPSYGIVHLDSVTVSNNDIHPGNVIHVCERSGENPRRAQVLRVSQEKRQVKEHRMLLERQDMQMKKVLSMCMRTIKHMKSDPLASVYTNMSSNPPLTVASGSNIMPAVIAESVPSGSNSENESVLTHQAPEVYRTAHNGTYNAQHTRQEVSVNGRHNQSVSKSQHRRSMVNSTPLPARTERVAKLTFDQGTQTDMQSTQLQVEKIQQMEAVVDILYARYQALLQHLQDSQREGTSSEEPHDTESDKDRNESLHGNNHEEGDQQNAKETDGQVPSPRALHIRRVSAHTTNNAEVNYTVNNNDMVPIGSGHASVPGRLLNDINWGCHTSATRQLLQAVFPRSNKRVYKKYGSCSKSSRKKSRDNRDRSKSKEKVFRNESREYDPGSVDKEEEQSRLELEMQKRRDCIERWRADRKRKEIDAAKKEVKQGSVVSNMHVPIKKWSLEDDSADEGEEGKSEEKQAAAAAAAAEAKKEEEEEIDSLDAYMQEVQQEVRKVNQMDQSRGIFSVPTTGGTGVTIITGMAKKKVTEQKNKGELIEQNQDGLEYSSEEENEDIKDTAANLASKQRKELAKVDHSGIKYMQYRKSFYTEVSELARMTPEELEAYRTELEGIRVKGKGCPKPIKSWAHCGISKREMDVLKKLCFEKPTPGSNICRSLTGKPSPAFPNKPAKKKLNAALVDDIIQTVVQKCSVPESIVRNSITTKCADESKMLRSRQNKKKTSRVSRKENDPPVYSSSSSATSR